MIRMSSNSLTFPARRYTIGQLPHASEGGAGSTGAEESKTLKQMCLDKLCEQCCLCGAIGKHMQKRAQTHTHTHKEKAKSIAWIRCLECCLRDAKSKVQGEAERKFLPPTHCTPHRARVCTHTQTHTHKHTQTHTHTHIHTHTHTHAHTHTHSRMHAHTHTHTHIHTHTHHFTQI